MDETAQGGTSRRWYSNLPLPPVRWKKQSHALLEAMAVFKLQAA